MAAYTFRASGTISGASSGTQSPGAPAGVAVGDLLLLATVVRSTTVAQPTITGWTQIANCAGQAIEGCALYGRIADGTADDTPSFDWAGTANSCAQIAAFFGDVYADLGTIVAHVSVVGINSATADIPNPALTITTDDCLVIGVGRKTKTTTSDGMTVTSPSGLSNRIGYKAENGASQVAFVWDYTQQTTATNIAASIWDQSVEESLAYASLVVALKSEAATPAPTFTVSPTVSSQTASAYTLGYTADANADNIYVGAYAKDATAPTAAQLKAGTGAHGTATEATTGSADSIVLTPSDSPEFPIYDLYAVLEGAGGFSSVVALVDEMLDPPAGKQFVTLTSVHATSPYFGTAVAAGDIVSISTTTDPSAFAVTQAADGTVSYDSGGDNSRQFIGDKDQAAAVNDLDVLVYDVSAVAYIDFLFVFNNLPPDNGGGAFDQPLLFKKDVAITPVDLAALATDPEGDTVTASFDVLPTGLTDAGSSLSGTPTAYENVTGDITWTDEYGESVTEVDVEFQIGDDVPDVVGDDEATAIAAIEAIASFTAAAGVEAFSPTVPIGNVISTSPVAGTLVPLDQEVVYILSKGPVVRSKRRGRFFSFMHSG